MDVVSVREEILDSENDTEHVSLSNTPSLVSHWNTSTKDSLIPFRYWTYWEQSQIMLGIVVSGPKNEIFLVASSSMTEFEEESQVPELYDDNDKDDDTLFLMMMHMLMQMVILFSGDVDEDVDKEGEFGDGDVITGW